MLIGGLFRNEVLKRRWALRQRPPSGRRPEAGLGGGKEKERRRAREGLQGERARAPAPGRREESARAPARRLVEVLKSERAPRSLSSAALIRHRGF